MRMVSVDLKEVTFMIQGQGAYSRLKYESGVHRVQRVPETESGGRIHTSTCTVAIMPEAEEIDFHLDMNDCKFDVFRASGNGGQWSIPQTLRTSDPYSDRNRHFLPG